MAAKDSFHTGVMWMLFSAAGMAVIGLLGKIGGEQLPVSTLLFWRYFSSFFLCLVLLWLLGELKGNFLVSNVKLHLLRAFFVLGAQYSFFYYIEKDSLFNALVLLNTGPLFIPVIEWGILRKHVGKSTWIGVAVCFIGVLCLLKPDPRTFSLVSLIGLFSGICQACSQIVFGINSRAEKTTVNLLVLMFLCAAFSFVPYLFLSKEPAPVSAYSWVVFLFLGLGAASLLSQFFRALAYRHSTPSRLASFLYFSILLAAVFDLIFFHTLPGLLSLFGACLVVLGGVLKIYLRKKPEAK